jgi:carboxypeptidase T
MFRKLLPYLLLSLMTMHFVPTLYSQQVWQRAKIYCTPDQRSELSQTGIALDHPVESNKKWIIADLSDEEIQLARQAGFQVDIEIEDLKKWSLEMNRHEDGALSRSLSLPIPQGFNYGSMGGYITYAELLLELDSMVQAFPNLIHGGDSIGVSYEGRTIKAYKISDNPHLDENEPEVLYTALHHAREPNSLMQMLYFMYYVLNHYGTDPEVTCLLDNRELYFVPIVNPDGYVYNQTTDPQGGGMWRKNRRDNLDGTFGVDLNRNYGSNWGYDNVGSSPNTSSDTYRGTGPFSEPETQAIQNFCNSRQFRSALNYHTFGNLLIYPFGYIPMLLTPDSNVFNAHAEELTAVNNYKYGTGVQTVGYVTNGDSDDWMYSEQTTKGKILSMTPEAGSPQFGFWPPMSQILPFCEDNLRANLTEAWLASVYVKSSYSETSPIQNPNAWIPVDFTNLGLDTAQNISATLEIIDANILSVANTIQLNSIASMQSVLDSFQVVLASATAPGTLVRAVVHTRFISCFDKTDTIQFYYGIPSQIYTYDFENGLGAWQSTTGWSLTTEDYYSTNHCITDSPYANYQDNEFSTLVLNQNVSLTGFVSPRLEFFARWRIEQGYDYCQLKISANLGPWITLPTTRTVIGTTDQVVQPLYDGVRPWGKEIADLTPYVGQSVRFRFQLVSDGFQNDQGFFFDDFQVLGYAGSNATDDVLKTRSMVSLFPNPSNEGFIILWDEQLIQSPSAEIMLWDISGKEVMSTHLSNSARFYVPHHTPGVYTCVIRFEDGSVVRDRLVVTPH